MQLQLCRKLAAKHGDPYAHLARRNVDLVDGADGAFHRTGGDLNRITDLVLDLKVNGGFDAHLGNLRLGQGLGRLTHRSYAESHYLLTAGAGAGLAAAFNAPLAGVIFCLEELTKNFSAFVLMGAISAAVTATTVTQYFFGMQPVFRMGVVPVIDTGHMYFLLILLGAFVGSMVSIGSVLLFSHLFGLSESTTLSLVPKSVTTPIAVAVAEMLGGVTSITAIAVVITGIIGAIILPTFLKCIGVRNPVQMGLSIGTASHAVGTSRAIELGETEGAISGLAIGVAGLLTALIVSIGSAILL